MPGMPSEPTLRKMIGDNPDFPILSRGKNGVAYEFDLAAAAQFVVSLREREEVAARARANEVRQFGLALLGEDSAVNQERVGLSPAERKALLEEELISIKVGERRGELIRKASVEAAFASIMSLLNQSGRSFASRLAKRTELTRDQIALIERMMDADLRALADKFEEMGDGATHAASITPDNTAV